MPTHITNALIPPPSHPCHHRSGTGVSKSTDEVPWRKVKGGMVVVSTPVSVRGPAMATPPPTPVPTAGQG